MEPFTILLVPFLYPSWEFTLCWKKGPWFTKGNVCVWCVVGGCGYVLVPRDVKKTKKEKQEQKTKKLILPAHLCSCWFLFVLFVWSFLFLFDYCSLLLVLFGSFFCWCLPSLALFGSCLFFASSGLILAFWIFLFMFISALSLSFFCIYLPLCSLNFAYWCSCLLLFAQFCSV